MNKGFFLIFVVLVMFGAVLFSGCQSSTTGKADALSKPPSPPPQSKACKSGNCAPAGTNRQCTMGDTSCYEVCKKAGNTCNWDNGYCTNGC